MARKSIQIDEEIAELIKERRKELGLTIEAAAKKAGVGTKTWSRYEAGEAISEDKLKGVCGALKWSELPDPDNPEWLYGKMSPSFDIEYYKEHKYWSKFLEDAFGEIAATSFVMGAELLFDYINMDLQELQQMPKGSHIGQLSTSWLETYMPEQFITEYDYDFLYHMRSNLRNMCEKAENDCEIVAHSVMDEVILMIMVEVSKELLEDATDNEFWDEWIYDLMGDADTEFFVFTSRYIDKNSQFHFSNWFDEIFWTKG